MYAPRLTPDQLDALCTKYACPPETVQKVFDLVVENHTNAVAAIDIVFKKARTESRDPLEVATELGGVAPL